MCRAENQFGNRSGQRSGKRSGGHSGKPQPYPSAARQCPASFRRHQTIPALNPSDRRCSLQTAYRTTRVTKEASPYCHKQNPTKERTNQLATGLKTTRLETKRLSVDLSNPVAHTNPSTAPGTVPNTLLDLRRRPNYGNSPEKTPEVVQNNVTIPERGPSNTCLPTDVRNPSTHSSGRSIRSATDRRVSLPTDAPAPATIAVLKRGQWTIQTDD